MSSLPISLWSSLTRVCQSREEGKALVLWEIDGEERWRGSEAFCRLSSWNLDLWRHL